MGSFVVIVWPGGKGSMVSFLSECFLNGLCMICIRSMYKVIALGMTQWGESI